MEYTEKEKKSLKFLTDKRDEAYGLMQFEDGEIYQLAEEEFNNYLTIEEIIDKQQKEIKRLESKNKRVLYFSNNYCCDDYIPKKEIKEKIHELETAKISIEVGYEKIFETKMDNARIIETLKEILGE